MSFWKSIYYLTMSVLCFTFVYIVFALRWHAWGRVLFLVPVGGIVGWGEVFLFSFLGVLSALWGANELKFVIPQ